MSYDGLLEAAAQCHVQAFRPGTRTAHARALKVYVIFSTYYSVEYKNPNVEHVLAFIQYVRPRMKSLASMRNMIGSLSTAFKRAGLDSSIFSSFKVNSALRSLDINSRYILSPKLPITPHQCDNRPPKCKLRGR